MSRRAKKKNAVSSFVILILVLIVVGYEFLQENKNENVINNTVEINNVKANTEETIDNESTNYVFNLDNIPEYSDVPFVEVNNNVPVFTESERQNLDYEYYSELDELGRCGEAFANIGKSLMPTEKRGSISSVKPTGWHTVRYDDLITDKYLYNRCHLIGYQLTGENANPKNLITGTRYLNIEGMLPFENMVTDYIKETGNHVLYRVTPIFVDNELVARGVHMEALSLEDNGEGISFNVYCYNVQPGITINYATGESEIAK